MNGFTITDVIQDSLTLLEGDNDASFKLALFYAAMSPMQNLEVNCNIAVILRQYRHKALPDKETLFKQLSKVHGAWILKTMIKALYNIESWYNDVVSSGKLAYYTDTSYSYEKQVEVREEITAAIKYVGRKCVSFALLIYSPVTCKLVPIDRHHLDRFYLPWPTCATKARYLLVENMMIDEQSYESEVSLLSVNLGLYAWYKWELWRQKTGASKVEKGVQSHSKLSVRK